MAELAAAEGPFLRQLLGEVKDAKPLGKREARRRGRGREAAAAASVHGLPRVEDFAQALLGLLLQVDPLEREVLVVQHQTPPRALRALVPQHAPALRPAPRAVAGGRGPEEERPHHHPRPRRLLRLVLLGCRRSLGRHRRPRPLRFRPMRSHPHKEGECGKFRTRRRKSKIDQTEKSSPSAPLSLQAC